MTVAELIEDLSQFDGDLQVIKSSVEGLSTIDDVVRSALITVHSPDWLSECYFPEEELDEDDRRETMVII